MISTYNELKSAIGAWLHRDNLAPYIEDFITVGESRIGREVRSRLQQQRSTATASTYINLPTDFLQMRALWLTNAGVLTKLQYVTPDALFSLYPSTDTGIPLHFTIIGDEVRFGPIPSSGFTVELWYFKKLAALSSAVNSLFTSNPDLYLYAALCAATPFLKNDARIPVWEMQYGMVRDQLNRSEEAGIRTSDMQVVVA